MFFFIWRVPCGFPFVATPETEITLKLRFLLAAGDTGVWSGPNDSRIYSQRRLGKSHREAEGPCSGWSLPRKKASLLHFRPTTVYNAVLLVFVLIILLADLKSCCTIAT